MIHTNLYCFAHSQNPLSQWYATTFLMNGNIFSTAEQYMMWRKAKIFGDEAIAAKLLLVKDPKLCKSLGRQVANYNDAIWNQVRQDVVFLGNLAKFTQDTMCCDFLLDTKDRRLVEAAPWDKIWGSGLNAEDTANTRVWPGLNLLGQTLERVREVLVQQIFRY